MYYLQSRYYDAEVGRFLNADAAEMLLLSTLGLKGSNLFEYCDGNPVNMIDSNGRFGFKAVLLGMLGGASTYIFPLIGRYGYRFYKYINIQDLLTGVIVGAILGLMLSGSAVYLARNFYPFAARILTGVAHSILSVLYIAISYVIYHPKKCWQSVKTYVRYVYNGIKVRVKRIGFS